MRPVEARGAMDTGKAVCQQPLIAAHQKFQLHTRSQASFCGVKTCYQLSEVTEFPGLPLGSLHLFISCAVIPRPEVVIYQNFDRVFFWERTSMFHSRGCKGYHISTLISVLCGPVKEVGTETEVFN